MNDLTTNSASNHLSAFSCASGFEAAQRMALALTSSTLVPKEYQGKGNLGNAVIALEIAQRVGASPLLVMQNLYVVHGKPAWSAQFVISAVNSCGRFSPLRFDIKGEGDARSCIAWAKEKGSNERLEGPPSSIQMAKDEGWLQRNGSKWQTMPEVMLRYRAASFFGRLYAPDILMGMQTAEEVHDVYDANAVEHINEETGEVTQIYQTEKERGSRTSSLAEKIKAQSEPAQGHGTEEGMSIQDLSTALAATKSTDEINQVLDLARDLPESEKRDFSVMVEQQKAKL